MCPCKKPVSQLRIRTLAFSKLILRSTLRFDSRVSTCQPQAASRTIANAHRIRSQQCSASSFSRDVFRFEVGNEITHDDADHVLVAQCWMQPSQRLFEQLEQIHTPY